MMTLTQLQAAAILGIVLPLMSGLSLPNSECSTAVHNFISNLCKNEEARLNHERPNGEECQIKGSGLCNLTVQTVLDQYPTLQRCVCAGQEEELCESIQALATQCLRRTGTRKKRRTVMDWSSSSLISYEYIGSGSCFDRMRVCLSDAVCNKYLASVLQACGAEACDGDNCQQVSGDFRGSMPQNVAEMLLMCECEATDQSCLQMKKALHSGTCGGETLICQETVQRCLTDTNCRSLLKKFQAKCWSFEYLDCGDGDFVGSDCLTSMDPAHILGADPECKQAFTATLGSVLHAPCSCKGMQGKEQQTCHRIHDVFHNRSLFLPSRKSQRGLFESQEREDAEQSQTWSQDYILYAFAVALFVGTLILLPLAVVINIW
uniref:GDNF/GAS1 domain-containing protein n=1 Tax=Cynoglossus semilaevis TaxID=244447 RepID=A0A3P8VL34_CYNSE